MKSWCSVITKFTVLLVFGVTTASSQTVSDSASIITTGTVMRGLPITEPIEPEPLESKVLTSKYPQKTSSRKLNGHLPETNLSRDESDAFDDTVLVKAYRNSLLTYYNSIEKRNTANTLTFDSVTSYYSWALKNRKNIITRQQTTGSIIFMLVVTLVLSGLIFSAIQFYIALKYAKRKGAIPDTSLKASLSGVEVSSSILGVIILTLSIVFFYLYLAKVYPLVSLDQITNQYPK